MSVEAAPDHGLKPDWNISRFSIAGPILDLFSTTFSTLPNASIGKVFQPKGRATFLLIYELHYGEHGAILHELTVTARSTFGYTPHTAQGQILLCVPLPQI